MARVTFDQRGNVRCWVLWEDSEVRVITPESPFWSGVFGGHIVVEQHVRDQGEVKVPYESYKLFAKMSVIAAAVQKALEETYTAHHANIQSNDNWAFRFLNGSLKDKYKGKGCRRLHIHIFGRKQEDPNWGNPIPSLVYQARGAYKGQCLNEVPRDKLCAFLETEIPKALQEVSL